MTMDEPYPVVFPFHAIAMTANCRQMETMLKQLGQQHVGPILSHYDTQGRTPLHVAIERGQTKMVQLLLNHGTDPSLPIHDDEGFPPLYLATLLQKTRIVECLLSSDVDPDQRSKVGFVALHEAARVGSEHITALLIASGATCEIPGPDRSTPLCWAVLQGHVRVTEILLCAGANPDTAGITHTAFPPDSGVWLTPVYSAAMAGNHKIVELLLAHGANPKDRSTYGPGGHTALHEAARQGDVATVELLLAAGADPSVEASDGTVAEDWAEMEGHTKVVRLLRKK
jgi:ankyrin repeat protein